MSSTSTEKPLLTSDKKTIDSAKKRKQRLLGGIFITTVAGTSAALGLSLATSSKKYQDPSKGVSSAVDSAAVRLAFRALGWGTFYAVSGVGALTLSTAYLLGVHNLQEFRQRMEKFFKSHVPDIPRNEKPGRADFASFRELFEYLAAGNESTTTTTSTASTKSNSGSSNTD